MNPVEKARAAAAEAQASHSQLTERLKALRSEKAEQRDTALAATEALNSVMGRHKLGEATKKELDDAQTAFTDAARALQATESAESMLSERLAASAAAVELADREFRESLRSPAAEHAQFALERAREHAVALSRELSEWFRFASFVQGEWLPGGQAQLNKHQLVPLLQQNEVLLDRNAIRAAEDRNGLAPLPTPGEIYNTLSTLLAE